LHYPTGNYDPESWEKGAIAPDYANAAFAVAFALDSAGRKDPQFVERMYLLAIQLDPTDKQAGAIRTVLARLKAKAKQGGS
jgi:hypothetical protein